MNASEPKSKNQTDVLNDKQNIPVESNKDTRYRLKAGTFLTVIGGFGFLAGFGGAIAAVKKQDPSSFDHGLTRTNLAKAKQVYENKWNKVRIRRGTSIKFQEVDAVKLHESGASLASRALAYGSLLAVIGCGVFFFSIWKLSGAKDLQDFRLKAGSILPKIPKNNPPVGRTEFSGVNDFLTYIIEEDKKKHNKKEDTDE